MGILCITRMINQYHCYYSDNSSNLFRPKEGNPGQYERWTEGGWILMDCNWPVNSALVWDQDLCRCDWGSERIVPIPNLDGKAFTLYSSIGL